MKINKYIIIFFLTIWNFNSVISADLKINARTAIVIDYHSEKVLFEYDADIQIYPASMTKIMTTIVAFDLINKNRLSLDDKFVVSENAWRLSESGYSSMFIMVNDEVSVEDLLKGIIVASGNDACVALAEGIAGSEEAFAEMMNDKAAEIGMTSTNFSNSSGINDTENYSTVRDIALMSKYLILNYPDFYEWYEEKNFTWDRTGGDPIKQGNRNPLLYKNMGADGIKTGYLAVEKYSLASSIKKKERRLIAVGSGFETKNSRSRESTKLLTWGLTNFSLVQIASANTPIEKVEVWLGSKPDVNTYIKEDIYKTVPKARKKYLKVSINYNGPILAPIKKDDVIGKLKVSYKDEYIQEYDLLAFENVKKLNMFSRLIKSINYLIWGDV